MRLLSGRSGDVRRPVGRPSLTADGARDPSAADAMAVAVLSSGKVLFWDGLEGMNRVQYNVVAEFGDVAQDDQSRLADFRPTVPTFAESGLPNFSGGTWFGLFAPAKTPKNLIDHINASLSLRSAEASSLPDDIHLSRRR